MEYFNNEEGEFNFCMRQECGSYIFSEVTNKRPCTPGNWTCLHHKDFNKYKASFLLKGEKFE